MKIILVIFLLGCWRNVAAQNQSSQVVLSNKNWDIVYRNYDNPFDVMACADCDSINVKAEGGIITRLSKISFTLKPKDGVREVTVNVSCYNNGVGKVIYREPFSVQLLPNPNVYLGGLDLNLDLERTNDKVLYNASRFTARYDQSTPLTGVEFKIKYWSITVGRKTYFGANYLLTDEWKKAFIKARKNTSITFNYCIVVGPDGF